MVKEGQEKKRVSNFGIENKKGGMCRKRPVLLVFDAGLEGVMLFTDFDLGGGGSKGAIAQWRLLAFGGACFSYFSALLAASLIFSLVLAHFY